MLAYPFSLWTYNNKRVVFNQILLLANISETIVWILMLFLNLIDSYFKFLKMLTCETIVPSDYKG